MKALPAPITKEAFDAWLNSADITEILTAKSFAMVHHLPEGCGDELNDRLNDIRSLAHCANLSDIMFNDWYDKYHHEYLRNPENFVAKALADVGPGGYPDSTSLDDVEACSTDWLIPNVIPSGEIGDLSADGGTGKGVLSAQLIASITTGKPSPFFNNTAPARAGNVLIFAGEDNPARVLKPRLLAAGADVSRVRVVSPIDFYRNTGANLTLDSEAFKSYCMPQQTATDLRPAPCLIIVDPLQSFLPPNINMAYRNQMRTALTPFAAICVETKAAGLIVMHTNKRTGAFGRQRLADSSDIWDLARTVWMLGRGDNKGEIYFSCEKSNYAKPMRTSIFTIEDTIIKGASGEDIKTAVAHFLTYSDKKDADFQVQKQRTPVTKLAVQDVIMDELRNAKLGSIESTVLRARVIGETGCCGRTYDAAIAELKRNGFTETQTVHHSGRNKWYIRQAHSGTNPSTAKK